MEPEICSNKFRNWSKKLRAKIPATTRSYSMAKIAGLNDPFSEVFERELVDNPFHSSRNLCRNINP